MTHMVKRSCRGGGGAWWWGAVGAAFCSATTLLSATSAAPAAGRASRTDTRSLARAYALALNERHGIPAFARKYNLACSACHTNWPELNAFGQAFKDRGYQLGNDRDSPIWQAPAYFPLSLRTTPHYNSESTDHQPVDAGGLCDHTTGTNCAEKTITQAGFDLSGIDFLMLGTLYKNITFGLIPTLDPDGTMGIETAFVRFDNLAKSPWANLKVGKFELDNLFSEKRITWLSNNGGFFYAYHYQPAGSVDNYTFGLGDNQIGAELMGHSANSYTRYSVAVLSQDDGEPGLATGKAVDTWASVSQAFALGNGLGPQRVGVFGYFGHRPTSAETLGGSPIPGTATDNKSFTRLGATAQIWIGNVELIPLFSHASDDAALGGSTQKPTWNTALLEAHYSVNARLLVQGRYEMVRNSQQADLATPKSFGDVDAVALGFRAYPFMFSRAGLAVHGEFAMTTTTGMAPLSGDGSGVDALDPATKIKSMSLFLGLDFAF